MTLVSTATREPVACDLCGHDDTTHLVTKNSFRVVQCRECGLVYLNPRLTPAGLAAIYARQTFSADQVARAEDHGDRRDAVERLALIERHQPTRGALVDVGCSAGWFLRVASAAGWRATGLDVSPNAVAHCRRLGLDARVGTLEHHALAAGSFDVVTMFDSLEHMPGPLAALRAAHRLLGPGGVLVVTTPNIDGLFPQLTYQVFGRTLGAWEHPGPPGHVYQFGRRTLTRLLERAGFAVIDATTEAIALDHSVGALENALIEALKRRGRRAAGAGEPTTWQRPEHVAPRPPARIRLARRAVRAAIRTVAWTLVRTIAAAAPRLGAGDSLVVIARKR